MSWMSRWEEVNLEEKIDDLLSGWIAEWFIGLTDGEILVMGLRNGKN